MNKTKKKNMTKILKIGIIILIISAIIIGVVIYNIAQKAKAEEITLNNLPVEEYTEGEAKVFYTKKLIEYLDTFQNDFHIKYKATTTNEDDSVSEKSEEFSKKGDEVAVYSLEDNERIVLTKEYFYHLSEEDKLAYKFINEGDVSFNMDVLFYSLEDMNAAFVRTGNETLNDTNYYFEEYKMKKDNMVLVKYYFDENNQIKYIKAYKEDSKVNTIFEVEMLENRTYDFMFDLGSTYQMIDLSAQ